MRSPRRLASLHLVMHRVEGDGTLRRTDEGVRADATLESIASVELLHEGGVISAANASQICDGASGALIVSESALKQYGLTRWHASST